MQVFVKQVFQKKFFSTKSQKFQRYVEMVQNSLVSVSIYFIRLIYFIELNHSIKMLSQWPIGKSQDVWFFIIALNRFQLLCRRKIIKKFKGSLFLYMFSFEVTKKIVYSKSKKWGYIKNVIQFFSQCIKTFDLSYHRHPYYILNLHILEPPHHKSWAATSVPPQSSLK